MTYATDSLLPVEGLDPGTYFLTGPPLVGKYDLLCDLLAAGLERGENGLFVSTDRGASALVDDFERRVGERPPNFAVVDCISESSGGRKEDGDSVAYVSSPGDLTGIGMYASRQLSWLLDDGGDRTRVGLESISTLLMYAEFETVFRFLHVLSNRLELVDALGLFALNTRTHGDDVVDPLVRIADGVVELREAQDRNEVRLRGEVGETDWQPL